MLLLIQRIFSAEGQIWASLFNKPFFLFSQLTAPHTQTPPPLRLLLLLLYHSSSMPLITNITASRHILYIYIYILLHSLSLSEPHGSYGISDCICPGYCRSQILSNCHWTSMLQNRARFFFFPSENIVYFLCNISGYAPRCWKRDDVSVCGFAWEVHICSRTEYPLSWPSKWSLNA